MDLQSRRIFRLSLTTALTLAAAYGLGLTFAFMAPLMAFLLTFKPGPPMDSRTLLILVILVAVTTATGLLLVPMLMYFPFTGVLLIAVGLYLSFYLTVHLRQAALGIFVAMGFTLIAAAALYDFRLGQKLVETISGSIVLAIICQWLVYPWFPEDPAPGGEASSPVVAQDPVDSNWIALRGTLIALPVTLVALHNPSLYIAAIMKSISLGQQASSVNAARAGQELIGSTFLAGVLAALFWMGLSILPNLWMYFLWTLLFGLFVASKAYGALPTRYSPSFWLNVMTTLLILIGPAVEDLQSGKDVYMASFVRLSLFFFISLYAWGTMVLLDNWRQRRLKRNNILREETS